MNLSFINALNKALQSNDGKIPFTFIQELVSEGEVAYHQLTPNMRVCVITLTSGHEVIGVAQVLDAKNDIEALGNSVALGNATNELWKVTGSIAKVL